MLFVIVLIAGNLFPNYSGVISKTSGTLMQVVGVTILLFILNNNMLSLKGTSIFMELKKWIQEFPFIRKSVTIVGGVGAVVSGVGDVSMSIKKQGNTIEERIKILEEEIDLMRQEAIKNYDKLIKTINQKEVESNKKLDSIGEEVKKLQGKLEATVIGDYRWQIFSAFVILLGLILTIIKTDASPVVNAVSYLS